MFDVDIGCWSWGAALDGWLVSPGGEKKRPWAAGTDCLEVCGVSDRYGEK
jgi:hypothetical protein